jgi:hypothetical protein
MLSRSVRPFSMQAARTAGQWRFTLFGGEFSARAIPGAARLKVVLLTSYLPSTRRTLLRTRGEGEARSCRLMRTIFLRRRGEINPREAGVSRGRRGVPRPLEGRKPRVSGAFHRSGRRDLNSGPLVPQTVSAVGRPVAGSGAEWTLSLQIGARAREFASLLHEHDFRRLGPYWARAICSYPAVRPQTGEGRSDGWLSIQARDSGGRTGEPVDAQPLAVLELDRPTPNVAVRPKLDLDLGIPHVRQGGQEIVLMVWPCIDAMNQAEMNVLTALAPFY